MADNITPEAVVSSATFKFPSAECTFSGDTVQAPIGSSGLLSGSDESWTFTLIAGGAGAVNAGVQRVTLASDDPAVTVLGGTSDAAATQGSTGSISAKLRTVTSQLNTGNTSLSSIDGKITACNTGAVVVSSSALPSGAATAAKQPALGTAGTASADVLTVQGIASMTALKVDGSAVTQPVSGTVSVSGTVTVGSHAVTNAGTFAVQVDGTALTRLTDIETNTDSCAVVGNGAAATAQRVTMANDSTGILAGVTTVTTVTTLTGAGVAHDGADSGNPHKIGAKATTSLSGLTLVANADRTDLFSGVDGVQIVRPHSNLEDLVTGTADITDGSSTSVISAAGSGVKIYITDVIIANSSSSNVTVTLRDGTGGSVKATFSAPANGGCHKTLASPIAFSANTAVAADPSAAASTVSVTLSGFKSKI